MSSILLGRCSDCSLNSDTSLFGYYMNVGNCRCGNELDPIETVAYNSIDEDFTLPVNCRCDVTINNRKTRYECENVADIYDCVDYLTYCRDSDNDPEFDVRTLRSKCNEYNKEDFDEAVITQNDSNPVLGSCSYIDYRTMKFCDATDNYASPGETYNFSGDSNYRIEYGNIMWNLQYQASRCGSARTKLFDDNDNMFSSDQAPNCLPYSENIMTNDFSINNIDSMKCNSGKNLMYSSVCNDTKCKTNGTSEECCISNSNCSTSTINNCEVLKEKGYKLCSDYPDMDQCANPCTTIIDIPEFDINWNNSICNFFCPSYLDQVFWFKDQNGVNNDDVSEVSTMGNTDDRVCSEEFYMLCKLAGCESELSTQGGSTQCTIDWGKQAGVNRKLYPNLHPSVYLK